MTEIAVPEGRASELFAKCVRSPIHMELPEELTYPEWYALTVLIGEFHSQSKWWFADALAEGERKWSETYAQISAALGGTYSPQTLANMVSVSNRVPPGERVYDNAVTFEHHEVVANLSQRDRKQLLERAAANEWTRNELREAKRAVMDGTDAKDAEPPEKGICPSCGGAVVTVVNPDGDEIIKRA